MNAAAVIFLAIGVNISNPPQCGTDWQLPAENERAFIPVSVGSDTFHCSLLHAIPAFPPSLAVKLAAGFDPEFMNQCADEADIIYPTFNCLIWAQWMHQDYSNCLALLNKESQTLAEETP